MPIGSEPPTSTNLSAILEGLLEAGVHFILVGGLAAVVQGAPVTTLDVDIVHQRSPENVARLLAFLKRVDAYYRRLDDKRIEPGEADLSGTGHVLLMTRLGPLDVLGMIEQQRGYEELIENAVEIEFRGYALRVLDLQTMIRLKRTSKGARDKRRLPVLEETLRQVKEGGGTGQARHKKNGSDQ